MSDAIALFIPSPNQRNNFGNTREMYVPSPSCRAPHDISKFRFVGRLMAGCITINEPMNLNLPSLVWKMLVGTPTDKADLIAVDQMCVKCMDDLCSIDKKWLEEVWRPGSYTETGTGARRLGLLGPICGPLKRGGSGRSPEFPSFCIFRTLLQFG